MDKEETLTATAPEQNSPSCSVKTERPTLRERWLILLAQNLEAAEPKFKKWTPTSRYRYRVTQLRAMAKTISRERKSAIFRLHDELGLTKWNISNRLRLPFALTQWLFDERRREFRRIRESEAEFELEASIQEVLSQAGLSDDHFP